MTGQILIVDDEEMIREMLTSALSREGYACHAAKDADEACRLLARNPAELALIDIIMPGRSGVQLLQELKQISPDTAVVMATGVDSIETAMFCVQMGAEDYIVKPFNINRILLSVKNSLEKRRLVLENRSYQTSLEEKVQQQTVQIRAALADLRLAYEHTLSALARALDARERETGCHSERVKGYALLLARAIGVEEPELSTLAKGALLHDIGKIGIPDSILLKPGKLTEAEWAEMKKHPGIGYNIITGIKSLEGAAKIVLAHQERYDGSGYPQGLKGEETPLGARIFALADTLDAMTSDRPYRKALPLTAVFEEVKRCSGSQFDPEIAKAFLAIPQARWAEIATSPQWATSTR